MAEPFVPLGEIVATHGLDGWLKLKPFNPATSSLSPGVEVVLEKAGARSSHGIEAISPHKNQFLIRLHGLHSIDQAARFVGSTLAISESALAPLAPREYYHFQVVGFEVFDVKGDYVGKIASTTFTGGGALYVVQSRSREHLIPAVKEIIEKVDFTAGKMIINPPDGLLDL